MDFSEIADEIEQYSGKPQRRELSKGAIGLLDKIDEWRNETEIGPDEITVNDYWEKHPNIKRKAAKARLDKLERDGKLMARFIVVDGHRIKAYREVQ